MIALDGDISMRGYIATITTLIIRHAERERRKETIAEVLTENTEIHAASKGERCRLEVMTSP